MLLLFVQKEKQQQEQEKPTTHQQPTHQQQQEQEKQTTHQQPTQQPTPPTDSVMQHFMRSGYSVVLLNPHVAAQAAYQLMQHSHHARW